MAIGSFIVGMIVGGVALSTYPTLQPLANRVSELLVPTGKYLGEAFIYVGKLLA